MLYPIADAHCDYLMKDTIDTDVTPEALRSGGVALQTYALFCGNDPRGDFYAIAQRSLERFYAMLDKKQGICRTDAPGLPRDYTQAVLSMEGGECLEGSLERFHEFAEHGVRMIALTWNHENQIGSPAKADGPGLKSFGLQLLREMREKHIAADVSHLSERGFWDVEKHGGPFLASHSNAKALCPHFRNLSDDQIRAIVAHDGFIGINFYAQFLTESGRAGIENIVNHIEHMLELGAEKNLGFGSDFDGIDAYPEGVRSPADFPKIMEALADKGLCEETLRGIAGQNLVDFFQRV